MKKEIDYIEARHVRHWKACKSNPDLHIVKERIHYKDGTSKPNLRFIKNYMRPFWVTKPIYRVHQDKREFEEAKKCDRFESTQSNLANNVAKRIQMRGYTRNSMWDVKDNPYIYGCDIDGSTHIMKEYKDKWPDRATMHTYCGLDIEADVNTGIISIITIVLGTESKTYVNRNLVKNIIGDIESLVLETLKKATENTKTDYDKYNKKIYILDDNIRVIEAAFKQIHEWKPDILGAWNSSYDINTIIDNLDGSEFKPEDIFSDPSIPKNMRKFVYNEPSSVTITESGVRQSKDPQQMWHIYQTMASFYIIDAKAAYGFVRVGAAKVFGGYGLSNILKTEGVGDKLYISDTKLLEGTIAWHTYMVREEPINYIAYCIGDGIEMLELDNKTKDIQLNIGLLSEYSSFDVFNSGPRKIINSFFFYALNKKKMVLGTAPKKHKEQEGLGRDEWIITLDSAKTLASGYRIIKDDPEMKTLFRLNTNDSDQTSGYPSDTVACGLSQATTECEILEISGVDKTTMKDNNMNLIYGDVNYIRYCNEIMGFPTPEEIYEYIKLKKKELT